MHTYIFTCKYVCMCPCVYMHTHKYTRYSCLPTYIYMHTTYMYVCFHAYMYSYICMHRLNSMQACTHAYIQKVTHLSKHANIFLHQICMHTPMNVWVYVHTYMHTYIFAYLPTCKCIHTYSIYVYIHAYTYVFKHTYRQMETCACTCAVLIQT